MRLYITVPKFCADEIMSQGLTPENCGSTEILPFLILRSDEPQVFTGQASYLQVEIPEDDRRLRQVNRVQYEFEGEVTTEQFTAIAYPPTENWEVIEAFETYDKDTEHPSFRALWEFHNLRGGDQ